MQDMKPQDENKLKKDLESLNIQLQLEDIGSIVNLNKRELKSAEKEQKLLRSSLKRTSSISQINSILKNTNIESKYQSSTIEILTQNLEQNDCDNIEVCLAV